jgi:hypothetical protein
MPTARQMVTDALWEAGILGTGQTALAEDENKAFTRMQAMMAQWQKRRWLVPALTTVNALGNSQKSNTVGPAGHFNYSVRPDKIQAAYFVQVNNPSVSFQLRPIFSYEDYVQIVLKELNSFPMAFFYDNGWSGGLGNIFIWPVPTNQYRIYLLIKSALGYPESLNDEFDLPPEYLEAIHYNLTIRLCSLYQIAPEESTVQLAKASLGTLKQSNTQVPRLRMPGNLITGGNQFNIYTPPEVY